MADCSVVPHGLPETTQQAVPSHESEKLVLQLRLHSYTMQNLVGGHRGLLDTSANNFQ
jgi:hypothetical protein